VNLGTVRWFDEEKQYGFITPDEPEGIVEEGRDLFVHVSQIEDAPLQGPALIVGQRVGFDVGPGRQGPEAKGVRVLEASP